MLIWRCVAELAELAVFPVILLIACVTMSMMIIFLNTTVACDGHITISLDSNRLESSVNFTLTARMLCRVAGKRRETFYLFYE